MEVCGAAARAVTISLEFESDGITTIARLLLLLLLLTTLLLTAKTGPVDITVGALQLLWAELACTITLACCCVDREMELGGCCWGGGGGGGGGSCTAAWDEDTHNAVALLARDWSRMC